MNLERKTYAAWRQKYITIPSDQCNHVYVLYKYKQGSWLHLLVAPVCIHKHKRMQWEYNVDYNLNWQGVSTRKPSVG